MWKITDVSPLVYMKKIPKSVKAYISNARYYLESANQFPPLIRDGVRILLLLTARENIKIAEEELHAWVQGLEPSKNLYRSHAYKLRDVRDSYSIKRIILGKRGTPPKTVSYRSGSDFEKLHQICRYGLNGDSKDLSSFFARGWHTNAFERALISKIEWEEIMVKTYEELPDYGK